MDDAQGKSVKLMENLGLFSGYALATQAASYGWINMDDTKLAKMDARSQVDITEEDKLLELNVRSGNLFFNITQPLAEDENMNIRTSTMMVGIWGTCGWVEVEDENLMRVYLLRGKVDCMVLDANSAVLAMETITAGQTALMRLENGEASITVTEFDTSNTPDFVTETLDHPEDWGVSGGTGEPTASQESGGSAVNGPKILSRSKYDISENRIEEYDEFLYDEQGNNIGYKEYMRHGDVWEYFRLHEFVYDNQGRIQELHISGFSSTGDINDVYTLPESGSDYVTLVNGNAAGRWTYYYNELGQCIEERFHNLEPTPSIYSHEGLIYNATSLRYDGQGKVISAECYYTAMMDDPAIGVLEGEIVYNAYYVYEYGEDADIPSGPPSLMEDASGTPKGRPERRMSLKVAIRHLPCPPMWGPTRLTHSTTATAAAIL